MVWPWRGETGQYNEDERNVITVRYVPLLFEKKKTKKKKQQEKLYKISFRKKEKKRNAVGGEKNIIFVWIHSLRKS